MVGLLSGDERGARVVWGRLTGRPQARGKGPEDVMWMRLAASVGHNAQMSRIERALSRLSDRLPLAGRQAALPAGHAAVHRAILHGFADRGRALSLDELGSESSPDAAEIVQRLADDDLVVLADGRVVGAYPFSAEPTPHRIMIDGRSSYAMCSLDAVAIAPVFERQVEIESSCASTGTLIRIHQSSGAVVSAEPHGLRLGIRWSEPDGSAACSMCREMVFLADAETAERWRGSDPESAGIFDLADGIEFGYRFFRPLVD